MRFALLGSHPDGIEMARALAETGRHQLSVSTEALPDSMKPSFAETRMLGDVEEILADPAIDMVIVAGSGAVRAEQLRRSVQSERHVLCVHPADDSPEIAYEVAMMQMDSGRVLLPLLHEALHPAVQRLRDFVQRGEEAAGPTIGIFRLLEMQINSEGSVLLYVDPAGPRASLQGWGMVRGLAGDVAEIGAFAAKDILEEGQPVLIAGSFQGGGLFRITLLPNAEDPSWRLDVIGSKGRASLFFPVGPQGPAFLSWHDKTGERVEESFEPWYPWPLLVKQFESALGTTHAIPKEEQVDQIKLPGASRIHGSTDAIQTEGAPRLATAVTCATCRVRRCRRS